MLEVPIEDPNYKDKMNIITALYNVIDPELFVNIIDLGLVYGVDFYEEELKIKITMTFSTKACPLGDTIKQGVTNVLSMAYPEFETDIDIVWDPEWNFDMLTPDGRIQLGLDY